MGKEKTIKLSLKKTILSPEGATRYLWQLGDGKAIESVILKHEQMTCACISSQVGCPLDCIFCATGQLGFTRDLSVDEIIGQVVSLEKELQKIGDIQRSFDRILFMGMGEPLLNYEPVVQSALSIHSRGNDHHPEIFLATSGKKPERIIELATDTPFVRLWISLCAADDNLRTELMPAASSTSIETLLNTGETYAEIVGHPVRVQYLMIKGRTDLPSCAEKLVELVAGRPFELQLSRLNPILGCSLKASTKSSMHQFAELTVRGGIPTSIFDSKGSDIMAGCGQLSASL